MRKIKAILFDMDGVLIDAKDWHYEALNKALDLFGMQIEREAHLATFDGLPTKKKLEILGKTKALPQSLFEMINDLKQKFTQQLTWQKCKPLFHHQYALSRLKREGYSLAVCSNSIGDTVSSMMQLSMLNEYLDLQLSTDEVIKPKPDPEIYLLAMDKLGVTPEETLILEDNEHGIQAARASGANVMVIGTVDDVNYERITAQIKYFEEIPE
jgi:beta-phosphoglucomutase